MSDTGNAAAMLWQKNQAAIEAALDSLRRRIESLNQPLKGREMTDETGKAARESIPRWAWDAHWKLREAQEEIAKRLLQLEQETGLLVHSIDVGSKWNSIQEIPSAGDRRLSVKVNLILR
jgi:hypothetical protein